MGSLPYIGGRAGVDEAGRGPIAGPVVVAAVVVPEGFDVSGFQDSKKLTAGQREVAFERIVSELLHVVVSVPHDVVDRKNVLRATLDAMTECLDRIGATSAVIDGNQLPPGLACAASTLVKGDSKDAAIAAASILAKVTRDRAMCEYALMYPGYGFDTNKGYGVEAIERLRELGPTPIHRRSFEPLKSVLNQPAFLLE